jgi:hypothetical protein
MPPQRYKTPTATPTPGAFGMGDFSGYAGPTPAPATPPAMAESIRRYSSPTPPAPTVPTPTSNTQADFTVKTADQFTAERGGAVDENAIREETRKSMQATIDAIEANYANLIGNQQQTNEANLGQTRAINARSGLQSSDFGQANMAGQRGANDRALKALEDERALKLAEVNTRINQSVKEEVAAKKAEALGNANAYTEYLDKKQGEAKGYLEALAKSGTNLEALGPNRAKLFQMAGLDESLGELMYNSLLPKASKIDYKAEKAADGKILLYGVDPSTGELKQQRINFDIPEGYEATYVDGVMYFKNGAGDLIPAPMDQSLYTPDYKNYLLSKKEGYTGDFNTWQTEDANRKRPVTNNSYIGGTDLNTKDRAVFNSLVDKANKSPLIAAADRTIILEKSIKDVKADPNNAAKQLNLSYSYIQALDTYQSAVREGELANLNSIDSKIGGLQGWVQQIQNGQIVRPEVAKQIADAAEQIVATIKQGAKSADQKYAAQAKVNGTAVEQAWNDYRSGFTASYDDAAVDESTLTDDQAYELYLKAQGGGQ